MPTRTRSPRVVVPGARLQFANTVAELLNLSPTGALIRMNFELRRGGEWPLVLELPQSGQVWLHGRVVRCRRHDGAFVLALSFVSPNADVRNYEPSIGQTIAALANHLPFSVIGERRHREIVRDEPAHSGQLGGDVTSVSAQ